MSFGFDELPTNAEIREDDSTVGVGPHTDRKISQQILDEAERVIREVFGDVEVIESDEPF